MIYDGIKFRRSKLYGWRSGNPETDIDRNGEPVGRNHVVIVRLRDCKHYEKGGVGYYDPSDAPQAIPLAYSTNNMGYGKHRTYENRTTCPVFLVYDAVVYQGTTRSTISASSFTRKDPTGAEYTKDDEQNIQPWRPDSVCSYACSGTRFEVESDSSTPRR